MKKYGYDKTEDFMKRYNYNYVIIDTENQTIDEIINKCKKIINDKLNIQLNKKSLILKLEFTISKIIKYTKKFISNYNITISDD